MSKEKRKVNEIVDSEDNKTDFLIKRVEDLHDEIYKNGYSERIEKNTLRVKGILWGLGVLFTAILSFGAGYLTKVI
uniref:Uncharacterized protein n=1 Tax=uncultured organism TaxID=155900 RepID=M1PVD1_9ZZZZ|nr:hypothetical protein FLSS-17_0002 [uncultured organism]